MQFITVISDCGTYRDSPAWAWTHVRRLSPNEVTRSGLGRHSPQRSCRRACGDDVVALVAIWVRLLWCLTDLRRAAGSPENVNWSDNDYAVLDGETRIGRTYREWLLAGAKLPLVHANMVQERLGHSSITMTLETYGHLFPRGDDTAALATAEAALLA
jgi:hypothetical protein